MQQVKRSDDDVYYVILSPGGESSKEGWSGLSYKILNSAIKKRLDDLPSKQQSTKWWHFAQDFVLHLNQELYLQPMKPEEVKFAEENQQQLAEAADFQMRYRVHLAQHLAKLVNDQSDVSGCYGHNQDTRCCIKHKDWKESKISWWYNPQGDHKFELTVYLFTPSDSILEIAKDTFGNKRGMKYWQEASNQWQCWGTECFFSNSAEAEKELKELSQVVFNLYLEK